MSDDQSTEPTVPFDGSDGAAMETVGPGGPRERTRRTAVIAGVAVAVVAALGGGAYAAYSFLNGGGPQPADVLPASTVAVVSVDLDPSAGQKIEAIKSIRRFPTLKKLLGLHADDDLREYVFDKVAGSGECSQDFDKDVKPWLGKRAAFAAVDLGGSTPVPVIALQISDPAKAKNGFDAIVGCLAPDDFAFVVGDDYLIASDSAAHAKAVLDKGVQKPLADDAAYQKWTDEAGDAGVINFYVSKRAARYATDLLDRMGSDLVGGLDGAPDASSSQDFGSSGDPFGSARDVLKNFQGLGGTVRFAGGGMELSIAAGGIDQLSGLATVGKSLGALPSDTAVALGLGISKDYAQQVVKQLGAGGDDMVTQAEKETGLDFPEDLQTLLGSSVIVALGGDAPSSLGDVQAPDEIPLGLVIHGDADKIKDRIATAEDHLGMHLSDIPLVLESSGDKVAIATSKDYADDLLKSGSLGSKGAFRDAVPNADDASSIMYVDFDSAWRDALVDAVAAEEGARSGDELKSNLEPLKSLGLTSWQDGDVSHGLLKIATD
ncbi:MAG TPA: DUF3352 domain-containing protein [Marmoricola sp.]|nr:DUF3352 domain-containing protein [Marmoricola sp.]